MINKNKGWTKIENETDLPNLTIEYHVFKNGASTKAYYIGSDRWVVPENNYPKTTKIHGITHYQEIIIPEDPIY